MTVGSSESDRNSFERVVVAVAHGRRDRVRAEDAVPGDRVHDIRRGLVHRELPPSPEGLVESVRADEVVEHSSTGRVAQEPSFTARPQERVAVLGEARGHPGQQ